MLLHLLTLGVLQFTANATLVTRNKRHQSTCTNLTVTTAHNSGSVSMLSVRVPYFTHIVSGDAALSSAGRSMVGSSFNSLAKLVRFANNVTTRNRISSFVEGSNRYINRRGALNKKR